MCETENPTFAAGWDFLVAFFGMAIFLGRPLDNKIDLNVLLFIIGLPIYRYIWPQRSLMSHHNIRTLLSEI